MNEIVKKQKFESIDMMRGIAILMVIAVHIYQRIQGDMLLGTFARYGQMGVQLFFIASAFTLCYSLDFGNSKNEPLRNFYIRRFFRIAPGYYAGIIIYFTINVLFQLINHPNLWSVNYSPVNISANFLFLNGIYPPANNNVVPGGWSIGTEMLFYVIFPFMFRAFKILQAKNKYAFVVLPIISLLFSVIVQFILYKTIIKSKYFGNNSFFYYSILNQLPVFCVGISMYLAYTNGLLKK
jgi:peptidoglycan/LPS O-acetylase OafA/YrhL